MWIHFYLYVNADINQDMHTAKRHLQHLTKQELKDLFKELGLYQQTIQSTSDSCKEAYAEDLIQAWILGKDGVLKSEKYERGATWENLYKALNNIRHHGIAGAMRSTFPSQ